MSTTIMSSCSIHLSRYSSALWQRNTPYHFNKSKQCVYARAIHQSVTTSEVIVKGCEKLPDLTVVWPFHLWPSDVTATIFDHIQQGTLLPWWAAILVGGALLKLPMYGYNIFDYRKIQQFVFTSPRQVTHFVLTYFNNLVTKGEDHALKMANDERRFTLVREGLEWEKRMKPSMFSHISYLPLYCIAGFHVTMFAGLHWLNRIQYVPLISGGLPWCENLTVADPYMILPTLCLITGCFNFYLHPVHWMLPVPEFKKRYFLGLSPALVVAFSLVSSLPADFVLYMISINLTSCILNTLLKQPLVYDEVGLLSSGEVFNRMVPQSIAFKELGKTLDRQTLLLEQKKEQTMLLKSKEQPQLEDKESVKRLGESAEEECGDKTNTTSNDLTHNEVEGLRFVKKSKKSDIDRKPHLNVKKVFNIE